MSHYDALVAKIKEGNDSNLQVEGLHVFNESLINVDGSVLVMVKENGTKYIVATGEGALFEAMQGERLGDYKRCELSHGNRLVLNKYIAHTAPQAFGKQVATIGLGDRLGLASPGHIKTVAGKQIKPILAQQSIRELNLTGRDYKQVIDAAAYAVFQEGYTGGYGADGDHLKVEEDIQMSLDLGFTMITLDCSDKINNEIEGSTEQHIKAKYEALDEKLRNHYESRYVDQSFQVGEQVISYPKLNLMKDVLIYHDAIDYMVYIYEKYIKNAGRTIDFEISIDETLTSTEPGSHYLVANELHERHVDIFSMAPRFCGDFEKGIDYIGDIAQFEAELKVHAAICDHFGYKLSVHSGSDKFSVFAIVAKYTKGRFHIKTAGTNWLEAVRTVAKVNPGLYRSMHTFALKHVKEALVYYQVSADFAAIKPLDQVDDAALPNYMDDDDARQLIHITYGLLLQAKDAQGQSVFKDEFYATLQEHEADYEQALITHIGKHLTLLGK